MLLHWNASFCIVILYENPRFSLNVTYFCLSLNVGKFGMDVFLTQFIFGLSEIPAHILCIWLLEALGRKISVMATLVIGGLLCILILAVPQGTVFPWILCTLLMTCTWPKTGQLRAPVQVVQVFLLSQGFRCLLWFSDVLTLWSQRPELKPFWLLVETETFKAVIASF